MEFWTEVDGVWTRVVMELDPHEIIYKFANARDQRLRATAAVLACKEIREAAAHGLV